MFSTDHVTQPYSEFEVHHFWSMGDTRAYSTTPTFSRSEASTKIVLVGIWRAGTGSLPAFHHFQAVWYAMPFLLAQSESFIESLYHSGVC